MKHLRVFTFILSAVIIVSLNANAQNSTGKLALKKGQKIQLNNTINSVTNIELMGQSVEMTSDAYVENQVEVKDKKPAAFLVGSKFTKMTIKGSAMGQSFSFDSDKKEDRENNEIGKKLSEFLDKETQMEIKEDGTATEVATDSASKNEAADAMGGIAGGVDFTKLAGEAFVPLPAGVKKGYTWSDSLIMDGVKIYRNYNVADVIKNIATIDITGTQTTNKTVQQMGAEVQVSLSSKLNGQFKVDTNSGIVLEKTLVSEGTGTADAMGQSFPLTSKITANTTSKTL